MPCFTINNQILSQVTPNLQHQTKMRRNKNIYWKEIVNLCHVIMQFMLSLSRDISYKEPNYL